MEINIYFGFQFKRNKTRKKKDFMLDANKPKKETGARQLNTNKGNFFLSFLNESNKIMRYPFRAYLWF